MSLRLRLILVLLGIYCLGGYYLLHRAIDQLRPRYLESMEESLVDYAVVLASIVETAARGGELDLTDFSRAVAAAQEREFAAKIFSLRKTAIDLRVYVVDTHGRVVFDSTGRDLGADYSRWNDVLRTLRGEYGARSTRDEHGNDETQVIYVAAPIRHAGEIVGAVAVGKPTKGVNELVAAARRRLLWSGLAGGVVLLAALLLVTAWVIAPLERLTWYARRVRDGEKPPKPDLPGRTLHELGTAFEEMRDALEGRQHAERYTQALAHEVKAPLAAIRAAAELMDEDMPETQRRKFLENIRGEVARVQAVIERLLELTTLEARKTLAREDRMTASTLVAEATAIVRAAYSSGGVALDESVEADVTLLGDRVLLREALVNLLQNALDFSAKGSRVTLTVRGEEGRVRFVVEDEGAGVPDYALARVFERFYSLPRPGNGRKSTGLGLTLVREIAHLHGGDVTLENRAPRGARAVLWLRT